MLKFTICFMKQEDAILMLNRTSPEWMGAWNGVGGKIEDPETPLQCILREVYEETGMELQSHDFQYKGTASWYSVDGAPFGGMHIYFVDLPSTVVYPTPVKTDEGILDWKELSWLVHPKNRGVADLKYYLSTVIQDDHRHDYRFTYDDDGNLVHFERALLVSPMP